MGAKAWDKGLTEGLGQAKDYAGKLAVRFAYSTNGQGIYGVDMATGTEGEVAQYPTPLELWNRTFTTHNAWRDRFAAVPFEDRGGFFQGRYYQDIAVERVLAAIADGRQRILLTLATGTGKTFIAFQIAWKLFHSRWNLANWQGGGEPTRRDNADTYAYFGEPVFTYSFKDGINDGFLTPFRVWQIATTLDDYVYTPDDTLVEGEIEAGKRYSTPWLARYSS